MKNSQSKSNETNKKNVGEHETGKVDRQRKCLRIVRKSASNELDDPRCKENSKNDKKGENTTQKGEKTDDPGSPANMTHNFLHIDNISLCMVAATLHFRTLDEIGASHGRRKSTKRKK